MTLALDRQTCAGTDIRTVDSAAVAVPTVETLVRQEETPTPGVPAVLGAGLRVPLVTGGHTTYANLDHAASAPCLAAVRDAVDEFLPWYASVHRGAGLASQVSTKIYERARADVGRFLGARGCDTVVFTRNTTDSLNLLARAVPRHTAVIQFDTEHHAALLPWRGPHVRRIPTPRTRTAAVAALDTALAASSQGPRLVVVTGASNVTGETLPIAELAAVAHRHGARIALDAAQLAPHRPISLRELDVDYVAISGHKLYAPYGAGALVGRADWLRAASPYLAGGGASKLVNGSARDEHDTELGVVWNDGPQRHEAGSPNTVGAYALGIACAELQRHADAVARHEHQLLNRLTHGLDTVPVLHRLRIFDHDPETATAGPDPQAVGTALDGPDPQAVGTALDGPDPQAVGTVSEGPDPQAVGTVAFVVDGVDPGKLAAVLSAEYGIGVRDGAFCAHIATRRLTARANGESAQAVRVSLGLGTTAEHIDRLVTALHALVDAGARWEYERQDGRWAPTPDPRPLPPFLR